MPKRKHSETTDIEINSADNVDCIEQIRAQTNDVLETIQNTRIARSLKRDECAVWQKFSTIQDAITYNEQHHQHDLPIFAHNHPKSNTNYFVVTSYENVWRAMTGSSGLHNAHFYEILRPSEPCHAFIDVEIYLADNIAARTHMELESEIHLRAMNEMRELARSLHYIQHDDEMQFIVAEASNVDKISLHIHVIIQNARFKNVLHVGSFMRRFVQHIQHKYGTDPEHNPFFFARTSQTTNKRTFDFWADMAVYTRNRNFRMLYNTKTKNYRPLLPIDITKVNRAATLRLPQSAVDLDRSTWYKSILQRISVADIELGNALRLLTCLDPITNSEPVSTSDRNYFRLDVVTKPVPIPQGVRAVTDVDVVFNHSETPQSLLVVPDCVDRYWSKVFPQHRGQIKIKSWDIDRGNLYMETRTKWCKMKGSDHANNHIYFILRTKPRLFLEQRCHDNGAQCNKRYHAIPCNEALGIELTNKLMQEFHPPRISNEQQQTLSETDQLIDLLRALDGILQDDDTSIHTNKS